MSRKILVFAGSARRQSVNKKLAAVLAKQASLAGATVTLIDLADYEAPLYHGDLEASDGLPEAIRRFKDLLRTHEALIVVTPEYNGHLPPLLVNTLAWASRPEDGVSGTTLFHGKPVAIAAASPGRLGGVRVLPRLRDFLAELGAVTVPGFMTLPGAAQAFDEAGELLDEGAQKMARDLVGRVVGVVT